MTSKSDFNAIPINLSQAINREEIADFKSLSSQYLQDNEITPDDLLMPLMCMLMANFDKGGQSKAFYPDAIEFLANDLKLKDYPFKWGLLTAALLHASETNLFYVHTDFNHAMFVKMKEIFSTFTMNDPWGEYGLTVLMVSVSSYSDEDFVLPRWLELGADPEQVSVMFGKPIHMISFRDGYAARKLECLLPFTNNPDQELHFIDFDLDILFNHERPSNIFYESLTDKIKKNLDVRNQEAVEMMSILNNHIAMRDLGSVTTPRAGRSTI